MTITKFFKKYFKIGNIYLRFPKIKYTPNGGIAQNLTPSGEKAMTRLVEIMTDIDSLITAYNLQSVLRDQGMKATIAELEKAVNKGAIL
jgi:hypothetical protein